MRAKQQELAPRTVRGIFATLSAILGAAVDDDRIAKNPCKAKSISLPRNEQRPIVVLPVASIAAIRNELPDAYAVLVDLGAGLGLRQGETFALSVDDIDWPRSTVTVQRQVKILGSRLVFDLPKNRKVREVPLPVSVKELLA